METRLKSLDRKLAKAPVYGISNSEQVRDVLFTLYPRILGGSEKKMHSFFKDSPYNRISMKELLEKLPMLKKWQDTHDEQHLLDPEYGRDILNEDGTYSCWHCTTIAELRRKYPSLLL